MSHPRAKALDQAGYAAFMQGDYAAAKAFSEEGLALYRGIGDEEGIVSCLTNLGYIALVGRQDGIPTAELLEEALRLRPHLKNRRTIAWLLVFAGLFSALVRNDQDEGARLHEEALTLFREINGVQGVCVCLYNLGLMATVRKDNARATTHLEELMRLAHELGNALDTLHAFFGLACVAASEGRPKRAARLWGAVEATRDAYDLPITPTAYAFVSYEDRVAEVKEELGDSTFEETWAEGKAMPTEKAVRYALEEAATVKKERPIVTQTPLTHREEEVTVLIARGLTDRRITEELHLSERTVDTHVGRISKKLGLSSRAEVTRTIERRASGEYGTAW